MLRTGCGESLSSLEFSRESSAELGPYSMVLLVEDVLRLPIALGGCERWHTMNRKPRSLPEDSEGNDPALL